MSRKKRNSVKKFNPAQLFAICASLIALGLLFTIGPGRSIHSYGQEPIAVTGKLERIAPRHSGTLALYAGGTEYALYKEVCSMRSYGIIGDMKLAELTELLRGTIGSEAEIQYVEMGSGQKRIVGLNVDDASYVDQDAAAMMPLQI